MTKFIIRSVLENQNLPISMTDFMLGKFIQFLDEAFLYKDFNLYTK